MVMKYKGVPIFRSDAKEFQAYGSDDLYYTAFGCLIIISIRPKLNSWLPLPFFNPVLLSFVYVLSRVWLFVTPWTVARQAPLSMRFPRQEYWRGLSFPPPGNLSQHRDWTCISYISPLPHLESLPPLILLVLINSTTTQPI